MKLARFERVDGRDTRLAHDPAEPLRDMIVDGLPPVRSILSESTNGTVYDIIDVIC